MHFGALCTALVIAAATTPGSVGTDARAAAPSAPPSGPLVIRIDGGFRWGDAAIGAITGFGAAGFRGQTGVVLMELKGQRFTAIGSYIDPVAR